VRMLLNQTSGMADAGFPEMTLPQPSTIAGRVASLRAARLVSKPGTAFHPGVRVAGAVAGGSRPDRVPGADRRDGAALGTARAVTLVSRVRAERPA
jgi:hypothetical protein